MTTIWQDIRYGIRTLGRSPGFTAVAILVLALGIGVNTAAFSIVNALFFRPLAVSAPEELVYLYQVLPKYNQAAVTSFRDVEFYQQHTEAFVEVTAHWGRSTRFSADGETDSIQGEHVAANYFEVLGVKPLFGRTFRPDEGNVATTDLAVVISHEWWMRRFKGDPSVVGKRVRLDNRFFTIVGIMGLEFVGLADPWTPSRYWVSSAQYSGADYRRFGMGVIGRLRPGVSLEQARAIVAVQSKQMQEDWAERNLFKTADWKPHPYLVLPASDVRTPFDPRAKLVPVRLASAVTIVVAIVLLIAAANIAGILMARGVTRTTELAIRRALGAGAWRLVRQLLTESVLVSVAGGIAGLFVAYVTVRMYHTFTPSRFVVDVPLDVRVLLFTAAVCIGAGVLVGLAPAMQSMKVDIIAALGGGVGAGATRKVRRRLRHGIVIPQVALALALLVVAGVHVRSLMRIEHADLGYGIDNRVVLNVGYWDPSPPQGFVAPSSTKAAEQAERSRVFYRRLFESVRSFSGVAGVGITDRLPVYSYYTPASYISQDAFLSGDMGTSPASLAGISSGYLRTMGLSLRGGREFDDREALTSTKVAIVSEALAKRLWPTGNAIGRSLAAYDPGKGAAGLNWLEVVGIVNEVDPILHDRGEYQFVYVPLAQQWRVSAGTVVAWGRGDPAALVPDLKRAVTSADAFAEVYRVQTMKQMVAEIRYPRRAAAGILLGAGIVGVLLASIGLYGVISYSVAQRLREIGIRATLGADRRHILALVLREGALVAASGAVPGIILSVIALRMTSNLVGAVPTVDVVAFTAVPLVVAAVVLLACYIPARRAARVDPMVVLRGL